MDHELHAGVIDLADVQASCISCRKIDSWPKLYVLLWLYEHRTLRLTCAELAERLYLGDPAMVQELLGELRAAGFLAEADGRCVLAESPAILACLDSLWRTFADPLARQDLIDRLRRLDSPAEER